MERPMRVRTTQLIFLLVAAGCCAMLMGALWSNSTASAARSALNAVAPFDAPFAVPPQRNAGSFLRGTYSGYTCTQTYTTTADAVGGQTGNDFNTAAFLSTYYGLSLVGTQPQYATAPAFDEYFRLNNATVGGTYEVEAVPEQTDNYNLGLFVYDRNLKPIYTDTDTSNYSFKASITFVADGIGPYYFRVSQINPSCAGGTYDLIYSLTAPTATPTWTPSPTGLPSATPPATPSGYVPDQYDTTAPYNDTLANAAPLIYNNNSSLTLYNAVTHPSDPGADDDWYMIAGVQSFWYTVNAAPDGTFPVLNVEIKAPDKTTVVAQAFNSNSISLQWQAGQAGYYYIHVWRAAGSSTNNTYHLNWTANGPTATPTWTSTPTATPWTAGPTDTPVPGLDAFEPNYDFDHAAGIGLNVKYTNINFVPLPGQTVNNDFFVLRVKRGMLVTCETLDLSSGTDTNMILYDNNRNGLAGNDDVDTAHGDLRSRVTVSINYDGNLYVLVGQGFAVPNAQASQYTYSLQCTSGSPNVTSTPTPGAPAAPTTAFAPPPASTAAPTAAPSATPPPTPMPAISVRPLATPTPAGPAQQIVTADLRVSYDANGNGVADPGEGVVGLPVRVYDDTTGALLAQGFTDDTGHAVFSVPSAGPIRVVVPYLSFETVVSPAGAAIPVLISPRGLPDQIP